MMQLRKSSGHTIDMVFILGLLAVFGITSFFVILVGAKQYQATANRMSDNYETRTISSYLEEKLNQNDIRGAGAVVQLDSTDALALTQIINGQSYTTYIYAYDGYIWEITVNSDTLVTPGSGQKILETGDMKIEALSSNLFHFTITSTIGDNYSLYVSLNSK